MATQTRPVRTEKKKIQTIVTEEVDAPRIENVRMDKVKFDPNHAALAQSSTTTLQGKSIKPTHAEVEDDEPIPETGRSGNAQGGLSDEDDD